MIRDVSITDSSGTEIDFDDEKAVLLRDVEKLIGFVAGSGVIDEEHVALAVALHDRIIDVLARE